MSSLSVRDRKSLEAYFNMSSGYVLEFSNRTFASFFTGFGVDIDNDSLSENYSSSSKANRLRGFWDIADDELTGKTILGLIEHYDNERANSYYKKPHSDELRDKCIIIANQLVDGSYDGEKPIGASLITTQNSRNAPSKNTSTSFTLNNDSRSTTVRVSQGTREHVDNNSWSGSDVPDIWMQEPEENTTNQLNKRGSKSMGKQKVFIVHGHDETIRLAVENFIRRLELVPIVLQDQASAGNTIIEKIEEYSDVDYAVILYTPCDEGRKAGEEQWAHRARQNVVFEHGYFIASLGRKNVAALVKQGVDIQNDIKGVVYISLDEDWKTQLVREFMKAELRINVQALFS